jgi:hypothetical protein
MTLISTENLMSRFLIITQLSIKVSGTGLRVNLFSQKSNKFRVYWKVKNQPDATKYVSFIASTHVSDTKHAHHQEYNL